MPGSIVHRTRLWLALHALICVLPVAGVFVHLPDTRLFGFEPWEEAPHWTFSAWRSEALQHDLQQWFETRVAFRGVMVNTDNSAYRALGNLKSRTYVIDGKHGVLFYLDSVVLMNLRPNKAQRITARAEEMVGHLASIRRKLEAQGHQLVVVLPPDKTIVWSDALPARYVPEFRGDIAVRAAVRASLTRHGVPFVDADEIFERRRRERRLLFPTGARHWSNYGACLVLEAVLPSEIAPPCAYDLMAEDREISRDFDLYRLQNLWRLPRPPAKVTELRAPPAPSADQRAAQPRVMFVGTSFMWGMVEAMQFSMKTGTAFYYDHTFYNVTGGVRESLGESDLAAASWTSNLADRDLYIVEVLDEYIGGYDYLPRFAEAFDARLPGP